MSYRFSGHETFPCRYAWLPKAYKAIHRDALLLGDDDAAMVELGIGKNMVRAARFWVHAMGIATQENGGEYRLTPFGRALLSKRGCDPFLEDNRTLWLLHWQLCSHIQHPIFAWDYMLNRWSHSEFTRLGAVRSFKEASRREERDLSEVTLEQHFDVFLHSYVPTRSRRNQVEEDTLDCPLVQLELVRHVGERSVEGNTRLESIYAFRREPKPEITPGLFAYCLASYWTARHPSEKTLSFRDVSFGHSSPGQIFKLPEDDIRARLGSIEDNTNGHFSIRESAAAQHVIRSTPDFPALSSVYT